ncbi:MAG: phosphatidate cytidylyltransferase [Candidatus Babeliales bacterium]
MINFFKSEIFKRVISGSILGFCFFYAYIHSALLFSFILLAILLIILFFEWPKLLPSTNRRTISGILKYLFISFFYPILPILILIFLNHAYRSQNILFPLYPFIVSWVGDTGAFILGKLFGKHKICPKISPGKSWEGLFGGFVGILIFNILYLPGIYIFPFVAYVKSFLTIISLSILLTITGFFGDISISFLKRKNGLKDTGVLLPGHGGLLDRFDAVFLNAIIIALLIIFSHILSN